MLRAHILLRLLIVTGLLAILLSGNALYAQDGIINGGKLFMHKWVPNDPLSPKGDGLGPMRNASSCVECHFQGNIGGAGPNEYNVELLSARMPQVKQSKQDKVTATLPLIHAGFRKPGGQIGTTLVLHKIGEDETYLDWRLKQQGIDVPEELTEARKLRMMRAINRKREGHQVYVLPKKQGVTLVLSQRNTPALFGAGLIDKIPDSIIKEQAKRQAKIHSATAGRVPQTAGGVGRFGWRGQTTSLKEFVLAACANELGLQSEKHEQATNPQKPEYKSPGVDLDYQQCDELVEFVANLPLPIKTEPRNDDEANFLNYGRNLLNTIGCNKCHVENLGTAKGIYSDLLLHDMGPDLSDPSPANPGTKITGRQFIGGSFGGSFQAFTVDIPSNIFDEWRTPPLWGVASSAPYMHDGRAANLHQAIMLHGGQGRFSREDYLGLPAEDRGYIISYLKTLVAPKPESKYHYRYRTN
ncbi:MAG: hypothetical protein COA78_06475 [Blastopirellula sp.]|nr:MAG: hypothetical protein COA78_06475 [Blastopirellula sp.]